MAIWIIIALVLLTVVWGIVEFNLLVRDKNRVAAAWSDIDVQLKRRADLLPKLVDAVKIYADYERSTLSAMTELRTMGAGLQTPEARLVVEQQISQHIGQFFLLAEDYPDLKASANFLDLQQNISAVERDIQFARRYYNGAVRNLNVRVDSVPSNLIAGPFNFQQAEFFTMDAVTV